MALLHICKEFGRLPREIEELTAAEFLELYAFLKIINDSDSRSASNAKMHANQQKRLKGGR
jgi:hypothetical protein